MFRTFLIICSLLTLNTIHAQLNMSLLSTIDYTPRTSDIWGWVDPDDGTEYAIVGLLNGVSIVSLADPNNAVEVANIPGQNSIWRDIKTWGNYAYVVTDQNGTTEGLTVIDMSDLPNSASYFHWTPDLAGLGELETCHNIYIDENGYAYLAGCNLNEGGMLFIDVFSDPGNPVFVGAAPNTYAHDVYVRDNKMYAAEIYEGRLAIYDVDDKQSPSFLGGVETPFEFTHNVWLSEDGNIAFTTDEKANAPVAAYDVTDPENILALDEFKPLSTLGLGVIPHNVHVWGEDWLVISYYTDGGIIADASRPENIIEVGNFDTFLGGDGGFGGAWGLYPFLPSGLVLVSDIDNGLFVLDANYVHACWLEGKVTDAQTGLPLFDVDIQIVTEEPHEATTNLLGDYKTGLAISGTYDVIFTKEDYYPKTISVNLENGVLEILDVELEPFVPYTVSGLTLVAEDGIPVPDANVMVISDDETIEMMTNENGQFEVSLFQGNYDFVISKWGFQYAVIEDLQVDGENSITVNLEKGYQDDFFSDLGWISTADESTESGFWERGIPNETSTGGGVVISNPGADVSGDLGVECYVTGNGGGSAGNDDVDGGQVYLTSPVMDLSEYIEPVLSYRLWWVNAGGNGTTPNDKVSVVITNGFEEVVLEEIDNSVSQWRPATEIHIGQFITLTDNMQVIFIAGDESPGHLVEAAVDAFSVTETAVVNDIQDAFTARAELKVFPNPFSNGANISIGLPESFETAQLDIFNAQGQKLVSRTITQTSEELNVGQNWAPGIYFLRLIIDGKIAGESKMIRVQD